MPVPHRTDRRSHQQQEAAERLAAALGRGRAGWVPPAPAAPAAAPDHDLPATADEPDWDGDPDWQDVVGHRLAGDATAARPLRDTWSARAADRLPASVRTGRWAVSPLAVMAFVVLVGIVGVVVAVRTAEATPGVPVPVRTSDGGRSSSQEEPKQGVGDASDTEPAPGGVAEEVEPTAAGTPSGRTEGPGPAGEVVVHVTGQVVSPGLVRLPTGARVHDAVQQAGGATPEADLTAVNLARPLVDGEQVLVPRPGEGVPPGATTGHAPGGASPSTGPPGAETGPVDLNTATVGDLDALPGIGPVLAERIVTWREENGRFTAVDELAEVSGIGPKVLERLRPLVTV
ncbi:helix-hairpin-helix domain-containing protein [Thalassiella azotivora]